LSEKNKHIEESISISFIVDSIKDWVSFIFSKRKIVIRGTIIIMILIISYNYIKSPVHYARTTFVLDNDTSSGSMGDLSSLASLAGINASSFIDASSLFQIDNIQELYRSSSMLKNTLLSSAKINDKEILIIERFAKAEKLINKWRKLGINLEDFKNKKLSRLQDSLIKESIKLIKKEYLLVDKPSRKTTILEIGFTHKDELLAKSFNENLVSIVNKFYFDTKTLKTGANLEILKKQSDSVKNVLNESILVLAEKDQNIPYLNALDKISLIPYQKAMIDVQVNSAIYGEIVKQLELAKVTHRNNMPLIQIIDKPILPLENSRWKLVKTFFLSFIIGVSSIILGLSFKRIINYEQN
tara:strand:- start:528 stop:1592 length:1065 start_codon:yes stop_codon:yes gene_type:complete